MGLLCPVVASPLGRLTSVMRGVLRGVYAEIGKIDPTATLGFAEL